MNASKEDVQDFQFIISEAMRIYDLLNGDNYKECLEKEYYRDFSSIGMVINPPIELKISHDDDDFRQIHLSYDSHDTFYEIAKRQIRCNKIEMLVTASEFVSVLKSELYKHIFLRNGELNQQGCTSILNKVFSSLKETMKKEDFYFPLLAFGLPNEVFSFKIAEIIPKRDMFEFVGESLSSSILSKAKEFCDANEHPYDYFLKVSIPCGTKESRTRVAKKIAEFIVGVIHLFSEQYQIPPDFICLSTTRYPKYDGFWFSKIDGKDWDFKSSINFIAGNAPDFWMILNKSFDTELGSVLCEVTRLAAELKDYRIIADRLIDAIFIFSSALQDKDESSRVVKLVTALERLVSLKEEAGSNITSKHFRNRVVSLISIFHGERKRWEVISREMYSLRSEIVHGSWSLYRSVEPLYLKKYNELTSKTILSACMVFFALGLEKEDSEVVLKDFYIHLEKLASETQIPRNES